MFRSKFEGVGFVFVIHGRNIQRGRIGFPAVLSDFLEQVDYYILRGHGILAQKELYYSGIRVIAQAFQIV